ncbi:aldo/keto reductase [Streptomyces sp. CBMA123]|uniref:aldo/keto reductase n=1 Tax=Streptomyces sp. CBMA123 TaxID=1896313 RepID=UPI001661BCFF|nr:aldo/keto reductase [Streptomyces sp. CBMA123]MBD0691320.1 hypothetical protein [Streptomyces sp. CBMA123]
MVHRVLDHGIALLDNRRRLRPFHQRGVAGRALADRRERAILATKVGLALEPDRPMYRNGRPEHIHAAIRASPKRLGTDHVDLYTCTGSTRTSRWSSPGVRWPSWSRPARSAASA